jgi:hypothetical protein
VQPRTGRDLDRQSCSSNTRPEEHSALRVCTRLAQLGTSMAFRSEAEHRTASGYPVDLHGHVFSPRPAVSREAEAIGHDSFVATGID